MINNLQDIFKIRILPFYQRKKRIREKKRVGKITLTYDVKDRIK